MKNINKILMLSLLAGTTLFSACKKDDDAEPSKESLLTSKTWKITAATVNPAVTVNGVAVTDWYAQLESCEKDDLMKFATNGVYTDDEGASRCNSSDPQTTTGTWAFNTTKTTISITESGESFNLENVELSSNTFKCTQVARIDGVNYTISYTLTAQ